MIRGYAELRNCRREYLLNYFGQEFDAPCDYCDNCDAGVTVADDESDVPFALNRRVVHRSLGSGVVMRYEGDKMVVLFDEAGYRMLATNLVISEGLLTAADASA